MAKMIDVTLAGDIQGQPTIDTVISINSDNILDIYDDTTGNYASKISMKNCTKVYYVKETRMQLGKLINT